MMSFTTKFLLSLRRPVFLYLTTLSLSAVCLFALAFHHLEGDVNPKVASLFDSFFYAVVVTTGVGLGDIMPVTTLGKTLSIFMMFLSTGLYVCFTGILAASLLEIENDQKTE